MLAALETEGRTGSSATEDPACLHGSKTVRYHQTRPAGRQNIFKVKSGQFFTTFVPIFELLYQTLIKSILVS